MDNEIKTIVGSDKVLRLDIDPIGEMTMDDYDFDVKLYCSPRKVVTVTKDEMTKDGENSYLVPFSTRTLGPGRVRCQVTAHIPDSRFEDGERTEIVDVETNIVMYSRAL